MRMILCVYNHSKQNLGIILKIEQKILASYLQLLTFTILFTYVACYLLIKKHVSFFTILRKDSLKVLLARFKASETNAV